MLLLPNVYAYPDATVKMLERFHVSLGNSSCEAMECNIATLYFYTPYREQTKNISLTVTPECFAYNFTGGDVWNITIYCQDGTFIKYDMRDAHCDYGKSLNFEINTESTGYSFFDENQFQSFWCAFTRDENNVEDLPTEFKVLIDGVGLHSKYLENETMQNLGIQANMALTLQKFAEMDMSVWSLGYSIFILIAILFGMFLLVGVFPTMLKWIFKKVMEAREK
jgi:hypothetical protein